MISTLASLTSAKPMTPLTGLLLGNFSAVWDFLQRCYSSSKTCMTNLCVRCKQTRADKVAGSSFPQVLSKAM